MNILGQQVRQLRWRNLKMRIVRSIIKPFRAVLYARTSPAHGDITVAVFTAELGSGACTSSAQLRDAEVLDPVYQPRKPQVAVCAIYYVGEQQVSSPESDLYQPPKPSVSLSLGAPKRAGL
ncbi:MAG: hypothetical protein AAF471_08030, partial [Myxococcota bacterium]